MPPALLRPLRAVVPLLTFATATLLALTGLALPADAAQGAPVPPTEGGTVAAWGGGGYPGTTRALDGRTVVALAAGGYHDLALTSDGRIVAWGYSGATDVPASLDGRTVTAIAAGRYHSLALTSDGKVTAWGSDQYGQTDVPASLDGRTVVAIAAGGYHSLALTSDGTITAWGYGDTGATNVPADLAGRTVTAIAAGAYNSFAVTADGQLTGWGYSPYGGSTPPDSLAGRTVTAVAAGLYQTLALTSDGKVTAWGGDPSTGEGVAPASLDDKVVVAVTAGYNDSFALTSDGKVVGWGEDGQGQTSLPDGLDADTVTAVSAGESHVVAIVRTLLPDAAPVVTGTPRVGSPLTATSSPYNATPDSVSYRWRAGGSDVGADQATYTPGPADLGKAITVTVTATKQGYASAPAVSAASGAVATGRLDVSGSVSVQGTPVVGQTLTTASTLETTPSATLTGQWLRDGSPVDGATATTYTPTNADAGATVSYRVTAHRDGYVDEQVDSDPVGPVEGGVIATTTPTIAGTAVVGSPLSASVTGFEPADADVALEWRRGSDVVGSGSTYTPGAADVGQHLTVTASFSRDHFDPATSSTTTDAVARAAFSTGPDAAVVGTAKVGQVLTATEGTVDPSPDAYGYRWFADGTAIPGAGSRTLRLTAAEQDRAVTVEVTATKVGYGPVSDLSEPTGPVASSAAPTVRLRAATHAVRRGRSTTLSWTVDGATRVTASGGWAGARPAHGTLTVRPTRLGTTTYVLEATNDNGTTTARAGVTVRREAQRLRVAAGGGLRLRGRRVTVRAAGLDGHEAYAVRISGTLVGTGHATRDGRVDRSVTIPTGTHEGRATVSVTGSERDRTGTATVRVVANRPLGMRLARHRVRASDDQRVTVTGLAAGERLTVTYQGRRLSPRGAHAGPRGGWTRSFDVDVSWGTKTVTATGQYAGRTARRTFEVVQRCPSGVPRCR